MKTAANTAVSLLLQTRGFHDQTLSGLSAIGHRPGELDIKIIHRETGRTLSFIETLNLDSLNTAEINRHLCPPLFHLYKEPAFDHYLKQKNIHLLERRWSQELLIIPFSHT